MTTKTPQQLHNLREALEVWWPSVPEANVYPSLCDWTAGDTDETDCGTVACFGGWCARWPGLQDQGLYSRSGIPIGASAADLFGDACLWRPRGFHPADPGFTGSDHELVFRRLKWALEAA